MPIQAQCPKCGGRLRVPEAMVGKKGKCPKCSAVFQLTPTKKNRWYVQTSDGHQRGPLTRSELTGLDPFCQVRREDWVDWKWAEDVLPELALASEEKSTVADVDALPPPAPPPPPAPIAPLEDDATPSLSLCPDCGKTVSIRAGQCPHCGCPAADVVQRGTPVATLADPAVDPVSEIRPRPRGGSWKRNLVAWIGAACVVAALASVLIATFVIRPIWQTWQVADDTLSQLDEVFDLPVEPPIEAMEPLEPPPGPTGLLEPKEARECLDEASAAHAKRVDDFFREGHMVGSLLDQAQISAELYQSLEALVGGDLDALPELDPQAAPAQPYQSQYDALLKECTDYVAEEVPVEQAKRDAIWAAAADWDRARRAAFEKQLTEQLQLPLGP